MNLVCIGMQGERSLDFTGKAFRLVGISARQLKPQNEKRVSCSYLRRHESSRVEVLAGWCMMISYGYGSAHMKNTSD